MNVKYWCLTSLLILGLLQPLLARNNKEPLPQPVIELSDAELQAELTLQERGRWYQLHQQLEAARTMLANGQRLASAQPTTTGNPDDEAVRVRESQARGQALIAEAETNIEATQRLLREMEVVIAERVKLRREFAATASVLTMSIEPLAPDAPLVETLASPILEELWQSQVQRIYFGGTFIVNDDARNYRSEANGPWLEGLQRLDADRYTLSPRHGDEISWQVSTEASARRAAWEVPETLMFTGEQKAVVLLAEELNFAEGNLTVLRAFDLQSAQLLHQQIAWQPLQSASPTNWQIVLEDPRLFLERISGAASWRFAVQTDELTTESCLAQAVMHDLLLQKGIPVFPDALLLSCYPSETPSLPRASATFSLIAPDPEPVADPETSATNPEETQAIAILPVAPTDTPEAADNAQAVTDANTPTDTPDRDAEDVAPEPPDAPPLPASQFEVFAARRTAADAGILQVGILSVTLAEKSEASSE